MDESTVEQSPLQSLRPKRMSGPVVQGGAAENKEIAVDDLENTPDGDISSIECGSSEYTAEERTSNCDKNKEMAS
jgi:hypothetical protein